jgi:hypothetical protein
VPTANQLAGRFTSTIIDPVTKTPFANNVVPQNRWSRLAQLATRSYFPAPNITDPAGNYLRSRSIPLNQTQFTLRGDQEMGRWGSLMGRYTETDYNNITLGSVTQLGDNNFNQKTRNWQVSHTLPIGGNLVNVARLGYLKAEALQFGVAAPQADVDALRLTGVFTGLPDVQRMYPAVGWGGAGTGLAGGGSAANDYTASVQPMWDISNTTTSRRRGGWPIRPSAPRARPMHCCAIARCCRAVRSRIS